MHNNASHLILKIYMHLILIESKNTDFLNFVLIFQRILLIFTKLNYFSTLSKMIFNAYCI